MHNGIDIIFLSLQLSPLNELDEFVVIFCSSTYFIFAPLICVEHGRTRVLPWVCAISAESVRACGVSGEHVCLFAVGYVLIPIFRLLLLFSCIFVAVSCIFVFFSTLFDL